MLASVVVWTVKYIKNLLIARALFARYAKESKWLELVRICISADIIVTRRRLPAIKAYTVHFHCFSVFQKPVGLQQLTYKLYTIGLYLIKVYKGFSFLCKYILNALSEFRRVLTQCLILHKPALQLLTLRV